MVRAKAAIKGHPIHPIMVTVPIGLLTGAVLADVVSLFYQSDVVAHLSFWTSAVGVVSGLAAAVPGLIDYLFVARHTSAKKLGIMHMTVNVIALIGFGIGTFLMYRSGAGTGAEIVLTNTTLALHLVAYLFLMLGGIFGGEMAYRHKIGMVDEQRSKVPVEDRVVSSKR